MCASPKHENMPRAASWLVEHARDAAEAGDRWLVGLADDIGSLGARARSEAQGVAESISAAVSRTLQVRRKTAQSSGTAVSPDAELSQAESAISFVELEVEQSVIAQSPLSGHSNPPGANKLDVLPATCHAACETSSAEDDSQNLGASCSAGVLPVLRALQRVVGDHAGSRSHSLDQDMRFWKLIELLNLLGPHHPQSDDSP